MITRNALRAIALATSCLAPMAALAQAPAAPETGTTAPLMVGGMNLTGEATFGLMGVMGQNANQAGRYTGFNTTGIDLLGQIDLTGRDPWYSGGTRFFDFTADNVVGQFGRCLGSGICNDPKWSNSVTNNFSNEGFVGFRAGSQGTWSAGLFLNSITYTGNVIDSLYTVSGNQAVLNNGLAPFGGATPTRAGVTAFTIPQLAATGAMLPMQTGTRRNQVGGDFKYIWGDWTITGAASWEHKEGNLEESYIGPYGGTAFGLPVNYDTQRYDLIAAYNTRLYQGIVQYTYSHFEDNNLFVVLPYPQSNAAAPFQRAAAYSTPPSNMAQYGTVMLGTNVIPHTRLTLNARFGVERQDDTFAPNTADPSLAGTPAASLVGINPMLQGTSANSPDITATVYQVKVNANTRPFANVDINAYYGIDGRNVTMNQFKVFTGGVGGETADATPGGATNFALVVPQDWLKQNAGAEFTYKLLPQYNTRLQLGYQLNITDRSNAQAGHSYTNTASAAVLSDFGPQFNGKLSFDYSSRSGNLTYLGPWYYLNQGLSYSGAYYQAPMTSEGVTLRADYSPTDNLNADFFVRFRNESYDYPAASSASVLLPNGSIASTTAPLNGVGEGIKQDYALILGPDVNYRPWKGVNLHAFYNYELLFYDNRGNGACSTSNTGTCAGSVGYFQNKSSNGTHTAGLSGEWQVTEKLKLKGDYTISYGSVWFTQFNGVFVPAASATASYQNVTNYPDINSLMNMVRLTAIYEVTPGIDLIAQGLYTSYHNNSWYDTANAIQGAGTTTISILTPGYQSPNYGIGMVMGGVRIKFGQPVTLPPTVPTAVPAAMVQPARSYLVFFDWDKASLTDRARQIIREAADNSTRVKVTRIEVNGYTDTSGTKQYNQGLSVRRADAVKAELIKDGVPANEITTKGFGDTHLLVPTGAGVREPQNRRVEIVII